MDSPQFQAHADLEQKHWWFLGRRAIVASLLHQLVPAGQGSKILDVGCGTGGMTAYLSKEYACTGIDPSAEGIAFARTRFADCTFIQGNAPEDARTEIGEAQAVLLLEVLEHVEQDVQFVQSLLGAMKPGAYLIAMAPADPSLWSPHDAGFGHYRRYTEHTFRALWNGEQVEELLVSHCNTRLYPLAKLIRFLAKLKGSAWGPGNTDLALPMKPINTLLAKIFHSEAVPLLHALEAKTPTGWNTGVSVIGVLRKSGK